MINGERMRKRMKNLYKHGLRPIQIWLPDTRCKGFAEECRRQSLLLRNDPHEKETLQWLGEIADRDGWIQ